MRKLTALLIAISIYNFVFAQEAKYTPPSMKYARFTNFHDYLQRYAFFPGHISDDFIEGRVKVKVKICANDSLCVIGIDGYNAELFEDKLRDIVLKTSGKWKSAILDGVKVDTTLTQEIFFSVFVTQNYLSDTSIIEKFGFIKNRFIDFRENGKKVSGDQYVISRREGYSDFMKGTEYMNQENYIDAIKYYIVAEQKEYAPINLYFNRGLCFFNLGKPNLACKDFFRISHLDSEAEKIYSANCK